MIAAFILCNLNLGWSSTIFFFVVWRRAIYIRYWDEKGSMISSIFFTLTFYMPAFFHVSFVFLKEDARGSEEVFELGYDAWIGLEIET